jgi:hypothetical protein
MLGFAPVGGTAVAGSGNPWLTAATITAAVSATVGAVVRRANRVLSHAVSTSVRRVRSLSRRIDFAVTAAALRFRRVSQSFSATVARAAVRVNRVARVVSATVATSVLVLRFRSIAIAVGVFVTPVIEFGSEFLKLLVASVSVTPIVSRTTALARSAGLSVVMKMNRIWQLPYTAMLSVTSTLPPYTLYKAKFLTAYLSASAYFDWRYSVLVREVVSAAVSVSASVSQTRQVWKEIVVPVFLDAVAVARRSLLRGYTATSTTAGAIVRFPQRVASASLTAAATRTTRLLKVFSVTVGTAASALRLIPRTYSATVAWVVSIDADRLLNFTYTAYATVNGFALRTYKKTISAVHYVGGNAAAVRSYVFTATTSVSASLLRSLNRVVEVVTPLQAVLLRLISFKLDAATTSPTADLIKHRGQPATNDSNHEMIVPIEDRTMIVPFEERGMKVPLEERNM